MITAEWNVEHKSCYLLDTLVSLYDHPHTLEEVLTRTDGLWEHIPSKDRIWVAMRVLERKQLLEFLARICDRVNQTELAQLLRNPTSVYEQFTVAASAIHIAGRGKHGQYAHAATAYYAAMAAHYITWIHSDSGRAADNATWAANAAATHATSITSNYTDDIEREQQIKDILDIIKP